MVPEESTTVWRNASPAWRVLSLVGLVLGLVETWRASFYNFYDPREPNAAEAAAMANIVLLYVAPLAVLFWIELIWRGRFAWLWIVVWTSPVPAFLLGFLTDASDTILWLDGSLSHRPLSPWLDWFLLANMGLQTYVGWRAMRIGRVVRHRTRDERCGPTGGARNAGEARDLGHAMEVVIVALMWVLAAFAVYCLWFPGSIFPTLIAAYRAHWSAH
jgi:hypothetical protein